jgi:hypothetical protein
MTMGHVGHQWGTPVIDNENCWRHAVPIAFKRHDAKQH